MNKFEEMQTFVGVVETGSLSAAADRMNIAKSAVSRRLAGLETRLGVQLLNRTTRRLSLTDSGRAYYQRCLRILADLEEAEQAVTAAHGELRGTVRLAAPLSFGILHLAPALDGFLAEHPELSLDLDLNDRAVNLLEEGVDLAVRIGRLADSSLVARRLAPVRLRVCASPDYLEAYGEPSHPEDLTAHQGLSYSHLPEGQQWQFRQKDGTWLTVRVPTRLRANNGDVLMQAAIDGLGVAVLPTFLCYRAIEAGQLRPILDDHPMHEAAAYALYPSQRHLPRRVRVLVDHLVARFGDEPYWDRVLRFGG